MAKISLFGWAGTGTSSLAKSLSSQLGITSLSAGNFFRSIADKQGINLLDLEEHAKLDTTIDVRVEEMIKEFSKNNTDFVIEGRLCWFSVPDSFKIKLTCNDEERIRRVSVREGKTKELVEHETKTREKLAISRYFEIFGIEKVDDDIHFDAILDTTSMNVHEMTERVIDILKHKRVI